MAEKVLGYYPYEDKYVCPVCNTKDIRGDQIKKHFQKNSDLKAVDKFYEENLVNIDNYLESLLSLESSSFKLHTKYLLENKNTSDNLPSYNSQNFLNQQTNKEEKAYLAKLKKLHKYIEPLKTFINDNGDKDQKKLFKFKNLVEILEDRNPTKRLDMKKLLKCEAVIKKMNLGLKCMYCDFKSKEKNGMMRHIDSEHGEQKHKCPVCDSEHSTKPALLDHINKVHGNHFFLKDLFIIGISKGVHTYKTK